METFASIEVGISVFEEVDVFIEQVPTQEVTETFEAMIVNNHVFDQVNVPMELELIQEVTETVEVIEVDYPVIEVVKENFHNLHLNLSCID